jgi:hypothetical protein
MTNQEDNIKAWKLNQKSFITDALIPWDKLKAFHRWYNNVRKIVCLTIDQSLFQGGFTWYNWNYNFVRNLVRTTISGKTKYVQPQRTSSRKRKFSNLEEDFVVHLPEIDVAEALSRVHSIQKREDWQVMEDCIAFQRRMEIADTFCETTSIVHDVSSTIFRDLEKDLKAYIRLQFKSRWKKMRLVVQDTAMVKSVFGYDKIPHYALKKNPLDMLETFWKLTLFLNLLSKENENPAEFLPTGRLELLHSVPVLSSSLMNLFNIDVLKGERTRDTMNMWLKTRLKAHLAEKVFPMDASTYGQFVTDGETLTIITNQKRLLSTPQTMKLVHNCLEQFEMDLQGKKLVVVDPGKKVPATMMDTDGAIHRVTKKSLKVNSKFEHGPEISLLPKAIKKERYDSYARPLLNLFRIRRKSLSSQQRLQIQKLRFLKSVEARFGQELVFVFGNGNMNLIPFQHHAALSSDRLIEWLRQAGHVVYHIEEYYTSSFCPTCAGRVAPYSGKWSVLICGTCDRRCNRDILACKNFLVIIQSLRETGTIPSRFEKGTFFELDYDSEIEWASILKIEEATRGQFENTLYRSLRKNRIGASRFHFWLTSKENSFQKNFKREFKKTKAMILGAKKEEDGFRYFCSKIKSGFARCGMFLHSSEYWLEASPDGILMDNNKVLETLEIKYQQNFRPFSIKKTHPFYTQVQVQLLCTGARVGHLLIYTNPKQVQHFRIYPDAEWIGNSLPFVRTRYLTKFMIDDVKTRMFI